MFRVAIIAAIIFAQTSCSGQHDAVDGKYIDGDLFRKASHTLQLKDGIDSKCGGVTCRDGKYKYCDLAGQCEDGKYHIERRTDFDPNTLDVIWFDGPSMKKEYETSCWIEYSVWGEPMIGFAKNDCGAEFRKTS